MLNIIRGITSNKAKEIELIKILKNMNIEGNLFLGYPLIDEDIKIDASLITKDKGIVLFSFLNEQNSDELEEKLTAIYLNVESKLRKEKRLNQGRKFMVEITVLNYNDKKIIDDSFSSETELKIRYDKIDWQEGEKYSTVLLSAIQSLADLKVKAKKILKKEGSKGSIYHKLQDEIATLDNKQAQAVLETTNKPQRIRGLAGSGKTIVLAMKAAYLHASNPEWDIVVTYNTRSLHNQFIDLIDRFSINYKGEKADFSKIKVMNTWGSPSSSGIYYEVCEKHGARYLNFLDAKNIYGQEKASAGIFSKLLSEIKDFKKMYDVILIDEAQDLPKDFFKVCYSILGKEKRIVWAYDELQSLNNLKMSNPEELFGYKEGTTEVLVNLRNDSEKAKEDIILETCYRNSKPVLTTAHALGFGIYRKDYAGNSQLVQMFNDAKLWNEIGYEVKEGELSQGKYVKLERTIESSPLYLSDHSSEEDLIIFKKFNTEEEQAEWLSEEILKNIHVDELDYRDILVIHPNTMAIGRKVGYLRQLLEKQNINTTIAGTIGSKETFFEDNTITISHIHRAKGNEAPIVYLMDADYCYSGHELIKKRNILFTAITRSKGWVRVVGVGNDMEKLIEEYEEVKKNGYSLSFNYPTEQEQKMLYTIHRDRTKDEEEKQKKDLVKIRNVINLVNSGELDGELLAELILLKETIDGKEK